MRILCLTQDFPPTPGGIGVFLHNLFVQLCYLGHNVDVLTPVREDCSEFGGEKPYHIYRYASPPRLSSIIPIFRVLTLHLRRHYDVVFIGHFMTTHALGALVLYGLWGIPYVFLSHGNDLTYSISMRTDNVVASWLLRNTALMLGNSHFTATLIRQKGYDGLVEVLNPGVDPVRFNPGVDARAIRQRYNLDGRSVLLTSARLTKKKNVDGVLRALSSVVNKVPDVVYLIAGVGNERERLEALCDKLNLQYNVRFLGDIDNNQMNVLYCASDVFVMPSFEVESTGDIETFGISYIEANSCGLPVIGGQGGGTADAVIDGITGILVNPHDVEEIAEAIIRLLTDKEMACRLGRNGRQRIENELSWEKVGESIDAFLKKVVIDSARSAD